MKNYREHIGNVTRRERYKSKRIIFAKQPSSPSNLPSLTELAKFIPDDSGC